jgi:hypothetical protein
MSFYHHLVSVICHPFTFHILNFSSENPQVVSKEKIFMKSTNQKQELHVVAMLGN